MRVLIIEDEKSLADLVGNRLKKQNIIINWGKKWKKKIILVIIVGLVRVVVSIEIFFIYTKTTRANFNNNPQIPNNNNTQSNR